MHVLRAGKVSHEKSPAPPAGGSGEGIGKLRHALGDNLPARQRLLQVGNEDLDVHLVCIQVTEIASAVVGDAPARRLRGIVGLLIVLEWPTRIDVGACNNVNVTDWA